MDQSIDNLNLNARKGRFSIQKNKRFKRRYKRYDDNR